ncbi:hypothetical protein C0416_01165 [bacterium]|nr:hypothetical protein [bacterium]
MKQPLFILCVFAFSVVANSFFIIEPKITVPIEEAPELIEVVVGEAEEDVSVPAKVAVLEYHNFDTEEARWTRTYENFYNDLLWLYNNDYRPVTVEQFLKMEFPIGEGKKPVLITFDDASEGQFRMLEDGSIDPNSAIGIMNKFIEEHPDFGSASTFFVLPYSFGQSEYTSEKLKYLVDSGREIGSHTFGHEDLDKTDAQVTESTLAEVDKYVEEQLGYEYPLKALAYPLGHYPDGELFELVKTGEYEGHTYNINAAFLVGANPALMPDNPDFDPYMIPRIQAIDEEWERWFNRAPGETEKANEEPNFKPYIVGEKVAVVEPKLPYELCKPTTVERPSFGSIGWKAIKYKLSKIQINKVPAELKFRDGKYYYTVPEDGGSPSELFFSYSRHYRMSEFKNAILAANPDSDFKSGDEIVIPDIPFLLVKHSINADQPWGIYLTGYYSVSDEGKNLAAQMKARGGKMLVFDVKEIDGYVFYPSEVPMVAQTGADQHIVIPDLDNYVKYWHDQGVYLAARMVIFKDINLSSSRPDLAIQSVNGGVWQGTEGGAWLDSSNEETQGYILALAEELAEAGIDEIQFDYIRFPTQGDVNATKYNFDEASIEKWEVIRDFIVKVNDRLLPYETKLSLDVYGVIAWNGGYDSISTGQKMECLGPYIDVVYPMVYPSHFGPGFAGFDKPGDNPYYFVDVSIKLFQEALEGTNTEIRPWLQAFSWGVSNYGWGYVEEQIKATNDNGINGYALWNASNNYF